MKKITLSTILLMLVFSAVTCNLNREGAGSLTLSLSNTVKSRTLLPIISMDIASYEVNLGHTSGDSLQQTTTSQSVQFNSLRPGSWTVTVNAANAAGLTIGRGDTDVTVTSGRTAVAEVSVEPLEGTGSLEVDLEWDPSALSAPSIESELLHVDGSATSLEFTSRTAGLSQYTGGGIATGYHTLILKLMDNDILSRGAVEVVRIVSDQTTRGTFDFSHINETGELIIVNITPNMAEQIDVTLSGIPAEISPDDTYTATASVPGDAENVLFVWYINGESVGMGSSYTVTNKAPGYYRLDVTAYTIEGTRGGSATDSFTVSETAPPPPAAEPGDFFIVPASREVTAGSTFTNQIHLNTGTRRAGSYSLTLNYNSAVLNVAEAPNNVTAGPEGFYTVANSAVAGEITITGFDINGRGPGSDLHFLNINWIAVSQGVSELELNVEELTDETAAPFAAYRGIGGSVTVR